MEREEQFQKTRTVYGIPVQSDRNMGDLVQREHPKIRAELGWGHVDNNIFHLKFKDNVKSNTV